MTQGGIGLALGRLHHLADQEPEGLLLAGAVLRDRLRVGGEHLADGRVDRVLVVDARQPFALDDLGGAARS